MLGSRSDDELNREFVDILHETVFGSFGKSSIRNAINRLLNAGRRSIEWQRNAAADLCERIRPAQCQPCAIEQPRDGVGQSMNLPAAIT